MAGHLRNLLTPSTPYYFNTMYDPFASDAVRPKSVVTPTGATASCPVFSWF